MARYDDLHTGTIAVVGVVSAILTFVIIGAVQVLYFEFTQLEYERKVVEAPLVGTDQKVNQQTDELNHYSWIDSEAGSVSIPISQAMSHVLAEQGTPAGSSAAPEGT